ncbi:MAG: MAPEG family protein [Pseudomonadota bacterium]
MKFVAIVAIVNLANYVLVMIGVGRARHTWQVPAPAVSGPPEFERALRIQQNSVEQLVLFIPGLYLFAHYVQTEIAAGLGVVYLVGRILYQRQYSRGRNRAPGFMLGFGVNIVLLGGALVGLLFKFSALN